MADTMLVDADVALEVASHEALIRQAYRDSVGVLTWCVGMTNATGHHVERYIGKPAELQHCMNVYAWALKNYAVGVIEAFAGHTLTKAQFAAALSFHWNTGAIKRASWVKLWKAGKIKEARAAFMEWSKPPEIVGRRKKEAALFFDGVWSNDGTMTEYTAVTSKLAPVWSSGKRINVAAELARAFDLPERPILDDVPQPDNVPPAPTLSPAPDAPLMPPDVPVIELPAPEPVTPGLWGWLTIIVLLGAVVAILGPRAWGWIMAVSAGLGG